MILGQHKCMARLASDLFNEGTRKINTNKNIVSYIGDKTHYNLNTKSRIQQKKKESSK